MRKVLWLDDIRDPVYFPSDKYSVAVCRTYQSFVDEIMDNGLPDIVCFDHDLGEEKTGYDACKWLIQYCYAKGVDFPSYFVQSANIVGRQNIDSAIKSYRRYFNT